MPGVMIMLGGGKPKGKAPAKRKGPADAAFEEMMAERGKAAPESSSDEEDEPDAAEEEGKAAGQELADAAKAGDGEGVWAAFKRMKAACDEAAYSEPEAEGEADGDDSEEEEP